MNDFIGTKFNKLIVVGYAGQNNKKERLWMCKCVCGNIIYVTTYTINKSLSGSTRTTYSCGCVRRKRPPRDVDDKRNACNVGGVRLTYFKDLYKKAIDRKLSFDILLEDIADLYVSQDYKCALSGQDIIFSHGCHIEQTASVDRIDSFRGYHLDNIQIIHKDINRMKFRFSQDDFIYNCVDVVLYHDQPFELYDAYISVRSNLTSGTSSKWSGYEDISGSLFNSILRGAVSRGIVFDLTIRQMWDLFLIQRGRCALTKRELVLYDKSRRKNASLDRIDSSLGYVEGNVQWVDTDINRMKNNFTQDYFIQTCTNIARFQEI